MEIIERENRLFRLTELSTEDIKQLIETLEEEKKTIDVKIGGYKLFLPTEVVVEDNENSEDNNDENNNQPY